MKSQTTRSFWRHYWALPQEIRLRAQRVYRLWRDNPSHPSLFFKRVKEGWPLYSINWLRLSRLRISQGRYGHLVLDR